MLRELSGLGVYPPACKTQHEYLDKEIPNCKNTQDRPDSLFVRFQFVSLLGFSRDESMYHFIVL